MSLILQAHLKCVVALACVLAFSSVTLQAQNNLLAENKSVPKEVTETSPIKTVLASVFPNYYNQQDGLSVN